METGDYGVDGPTALKHVAEVKRQDKGTVTIHVLLLEEGFVLGIKRRDTIATHNIVQVKR